MKLERTNDHYKNGRNNIVYMIDGLGMGGAERLMTPILSSLDPNNFSARVAVFQNRNGNPIANELRELGIPVDLISIPYLRDFTALPRIINYLRTTNANLVHAQLEFANILGGVAAKRLHIPCVSTLHTIPSQEGSLKSKLHQGLEYFCLRHFFDMIISVSNETRVSHLKAGRIPEKKMRTIYNGIDLAHFGESLQVEREAVLGDLGIPASAVVLTTVAVLREPKGIQFMIRAMPEILAVHPNAYYLVIGSGDFEGELRKEAAQSSMERIVFTGMRKDIPQLLSVSNIFVLPTLTEALPTVLAEAMALRLPILASRVGGVPEMIEDGINGRLVPPADTRQLASVCNDMLTNLKATADMGEAGRKIVKERFDVRVQASQLQDLYRELITDYE